ncbi:MAG: Maf family nucleotide pyrophosphatase [Acidocella sp.]|nr:Maf family nucleotide pyrophosphatase [Acidocella sp.]
MKLILASGSQTRQTMLRNAGLDFSVIVPDIDEAAIKAASSANTAELALQLANAKAAEIAALCPWATVIGADQILICEKRRFDKPKNITQAAEHLRFLSGKTHGLVTAVAVHHGTQRIWHHVATPNLTMRKLADDDIDAYLAASGNRICNMVGAYQLEGHGVNLFNDISGDFFTILGLPLLPLLGFLRERAVPA